MVDETLRSNQVLRDDLGQLDADRTALVAILAPRLEPLTAARL